MVSLIDLETFDSRLALEVHTRPFATMPIFERAAQELYFSIEINKRTDEISDIQVQFTAENITHRLRSIKSEDIGKLITVQGIIIKASRALIKAKILVLQCKVCKHIKEIVVENGLVPINIPIFCERPKVPGQGGDQCPRDCYKIKSELGRFIDFQYLKLQEDTEYLPTGEVPRTYQVVCDRNLVDQLVPGNRVIMSVVYAVSERQTFSTKGAGPSLRTPYMYLLGYQNLSDKLTKNSAFSQSEELQFNEKSKDPDLFNWIVESIAPSIFGHIDVKKAIACLLFGGSRKQLPDNTRLRGDINVLLWGDPSTAKSQLLKFAHKLFPISIYTSGKGSSAAGLTAAIIKDSSTREFQLEGGALVLADGGIVCIDEFDKMRAQDRVAIHEAMEQQTISIAKAGITTVLNSRTSILAAANPIFGSFNDLKSYSEQMDLQTTILSRFDCIFTIRDDRSTENNTRVAEHILNLHIKGKDEKKNEEETEARIDFLRKYIIFARNKCHPRLTEEAAIALQNEYVEQRRAAKSHSKTAHIPITVRQLEAIIRLSESIAKMRLSSEVSKEDAAIAKEIFEVSTMQSVKSEKSLSSRKDPEYLEEMARIEDHIKTKLPIGGKIKEQVLIKEIESNARVKEAVRETLLLLIEKGDLIQSAKNEFLTRHK